MLVIMRSFSTSVFLDYWVELLMLRLWLLLEALLLLAASNSCSRKDSLPVSCLFSLTAYSQSNLILWQRSANIYCEDTYYCIIFNFSARLRFYTRSSQICSLRDLLSLSSCSQQLANPSLCSFLRKGSSCVTCILHSFLRRMHQLKSLRLSYCNLRLDCLRSVSVR